MPELHEVTLNQLLKYCSSQSVQQHAFEKTAWTSQAALMISIIFPCH